MGLAALLLLSLYAFNGRGFGVLDDTGWMHDGADRPAAFEDPEAVGDQAIVPSPAERVAAGAASPNTGGDPETASDPAQPDTPTPTSPAAVEPTPPPAVATPSPTALPTTVVFEGTGSQTLPFSYPGGSVRVLSEASSPSAAGCVYTGTVQAVAPTVLVYDPSVTTTVIFLEGPGGDQGWVDLVLEAGTYQIVIDSDCTWRVTVAPG